jgi:hypothetical protein
MNPNPEALTSLETLPARLYVEDGYLVAEYRGKLYRRSIPTEKTLASSLKQTIQSLQETGDGTTIEDLIQRHFDSSLYNEWLEALYEELKQRGEWPFDEEYKD